MVRADDHAAERTESASGLFRWTNYESRGRGSFFLPSYLPNLSKIVQNNDTLIGSKEFSSRIGFENIDVKMET